ncbi:hypothetical protein ACLB2K_033224 [Fragaria x ananassa]
MAGVRKRNGYSKMDKEDPEEVIHRRAQFLVYKVMQQAEYRRRPSNLRIRIRKLKVKFGMRLKKLRKSMLLSVSAARVVVYKQVSRQLKTCKSLFGRVEEPLPAFNKYIRACMVWTILVLILKLRKSMLLSVSAARVVVYKQVSRQLKTCKSLFGRVEEPLPAFNSSIPCRPYCLIVD